MIPSPRTQVLNALMGQFSIENSPPIEGYFFCRHPNSPKGNMVVVLLSQDHIKPFVELEIDDLSHLSLTGAYLKTPALPLTDLITYVVAYQVPGRPVPVYLTPLKLLLHAAVARLANSARAA